MAHWFKEKFDKVKKELGDVAWDIKYHTKKHIIKPTKQIVGEVKDLIEDENYTMKDFKGDLKTAFKETFIERPKDPTYQEIWDINKNSLDRDADLEKLYPEGEKDSYYSNNRVINNLKKGTHLSFNNLANIMDELETNPKNKEELEKQAQKEAEAFISLRSRASDMEDKKFFEEEYQKETDPELKKKYLDSMVSFSNYHDRETMKQYKKEKPAISVKDYYWGAMYHSSFDADLSKQAMQEANSLGEKVGIAKMFSSLFKKEDKSKNLTFDRD